MEYYIDILVWNILAAAFIGTCIYLAIGSLLVMVFSFLEEEFDIEKPMDAFKWYANRTMLLHILLGWYIGFKIFEYLGLLF
jgi:hypothetical protein